MNILGQAKSIKLSVEKLKIKHDLLHQLDKLVLYNTIAKAVGFEPRGREFDSYHMKIDYQVGKKILPLFTELNF